MQQMRALHLIAEISSARLPFGKSEPSNCSSYSVLGLARRQFASNFVARCSLHGLSRELINILTAVSVLLGREHRRVHVAARYARLGVNNHSGAPGLTVMSNFQVKIFNIACSAECLVDTMDGGDGGHP